MGVIWLSAEAIPRALRSRNALRDFAPSKQPKHCHNNFITLVPHIGVTPHGNVMGTVISKQDMDNSSWIAKHKVGRHVVVGPERPSGHDGDEREPELGQLGRQLGRGRQCGPLPATHPSYSTNELTAQK